MRGELAVRHAGDRPHPAGAARSAAAADDLYEANLGRARGTGRYPRLGDAEGTLCCGGRRHEPRGRSPLMMIEGLLSRLRRDGVHIWLEDGRLRYRAPKGVLTPERIAEIRVSQHEIGAFLADAQSLASELTPIGGARPPGALPLSFAQERLWFLEQLGLAGGAHHIATTIPPRGALHPRHY